MMTVKNMKPWLAVGSLVAAGALLVACGSSDDIKDGATDAAGMKELIEQGLAGEKTIKCVGGDDDVEGRFYIASDEKFRFDIKEDGDAPSVLSNGDEVFMWVDGESAGVTMGGAEAQLFQSVMVDEVFGDLSSADLDEMDECGVYTGGDGVFQAPGKVDFVTVESDADFAQLEDTAPKLIDLMFS